jgi:hypothetical protein
LNPAKIETILFTPAIFRHEIFLYRLLPNYRTWNPYTTIVERFRDLRKLSDMEDISESDHSPAKAHRRQVQRRISFQNLCAFAPLREIFRDLAAASPR